MNFIPSEPLYPHDITQKDLRVTEGFFGPKKCQKWPHWGKLFETVFFSLMNLKLCEKHQNNIGYIGL